MKALVIGGDGLLGSHLVRKLLEKKIELRVLIQPGSTSPTLEGLDLELIEGDLLDEGDGLVKASSDCDYVFHLAAITDMWAPKDITWKVNYDGTERVLEACLKNKVKRLIFTGSASSYQFGSLDAPADESSPFPEAYRAGAYMESKYEAMMLVKRYVKERGLDAVVIAPTFMLGSLDWRPSSGELVRQFITKQMKVTSPGGRNFAYAPDVAEAMINAMDRGKAGESFITGGPNLSYKEFFGLVAGQAGFAGPEKIVPKPLLLAIGAGGSLVTKLTGKKVALNYTLAKLAICSTFYSSQKAIDELGMPQTDIDFAIAETIRSLKEYGHIA